MITEVLFDPELDRARLVERVEAVTERYIDEQRERKRQGKRCRCGILSNMCKAGHPDGRCEFVCVACGRAFPSGSGCQKDSR